jgi:misacylated tRNA(Ala) deacylase
MLYMPSTEGNYVREFDARVLRRKDDYVVLDRTAFYPEGGGQPTDVGTLSWPGGGPVRVARVEKKGIIKHIIEGDPQLLPDQAHGAIDWPRRHAHMRMHTAQHLISAVVLELHGAHTVGSQLYADRSRIDFDRVKFKDEDIGTAKARFDALVDQAVPVRVLEMDRAEVEARTKKGRAQLDLLPKAVTRLRVIEIEGYDLCPCAGTHVRNLSELGHMVPLGRESKGAQKERLHYTLEPPKQVA